jgi:hypothetical protein
MEQTNKRFNPHFHVVLDTNCIMGGSRNLIGNKSSATIRDISSKQDPGTSWYLPRMVKDERSYQLLAGATALHAGILKAEKFLGRSLGVREDELQTAVSALVQKGVVEHGLIEIALDPSRVDWAELMKRAVYREAPFQAGETEKGFRDAIILETFSQLAETRCSEDPDCMAVLVSNDGLLADAVIKLRETLKYSDRILVTRSLDELTSLINGVPANLTAIAVDKLIEKAGRAFYDPLETTGLYISKGVRRRIFIEHGAELGALPPDESEMKYHTVFRRFEFALPVFIGKKGAVLTFRSQVTFVVAVRAGAPTSAPTILENLSQVGAQSLRISPFGVSAGPRSAVSLAAPLTETASASVNIPGISLTSNSANVITISNMGKETTLHVTPTEERRREGRHRFDIIWKADLVDEELVNLELLSIAANEADWDEVI